MNNKQEGQVLLIAAMFLATALTIVLMVSFRSTTETKLTKLEEEYQKALVAAEAGIEAALKQGTVADIGSLNVPAGFTGQATIDSTPAITFVTPLLQKDEAYTFYLAKPAGSADTPDFSNFATTATPQYTNQDLTVCFGSASSNPAIEIMLLKQNNVLKKYTVNPTSSTIINNAQSASTPGANDCPTGSSAFTNEFTVPSADVGGSSLAILVRLISLTSSSTNVGFKSPGGVNFPLQGRTVVSSAQSPIGVSTTVQLFQSYPQIPSDFFVTSF